MILKLYLLWQQYLNTSVSNQFVRPFLILFGALVVIDGPAAIQRLFGYDMGISAGSQKMMSFLRMVQQARMQHHFQARLALQMHINLILQPDRAQYREPVQVIAVHRKQQVELCRNQM